MVDQEVADILEEIRSRVRAGATPPETSVPTNSNATEVEAVAEPVFPEPPLVTDSYSSLIILARAWDRLPPLVSNRSGMSARLELWLKSKLRNALRWITWEQINFNAATHRTFLELIESLTAYEQELHRVHHQLKKQLHEQWSVESASRKQQFDQQQTKIDSQRAVLQTQRDELRKEIQNRRGELAQQQGALDLLQFELNEQRSWLFTQHSALKARLTELGDQQASQVTQQSLLETEIDELKTLHAKDLDAQQSAAQSQLANLVQEFRERDERLLDEQRVCVKQLSLELRESQVLQDRARREVESRIAKLEEQDS